MDHRTNGESPHDLLLALAGRVDDDLLAWCRELVAVGEDARAVVLACATLAADRVRLPAGVRAALVAQAAAARADLDVDRALPPALDVADGTPHRFDAWLPVVDTLAAAVAGLPARQVAGCRLHVTARTTPAGAAPGPLPQPVLLAVVDAGDPRPADVLTYQLAISCARAGVPAAVEVVAAGRSLPAYQETALQTARPVSPAGEPARDDVPAPRAAPVLPTVVAVPERSSLAARMAAWDTFDTPVAEDEPAPDAVPPDPEPRPVPFGRDTADPLSFDAAAPAAAPQEIPEPADRPRWPATGSLVQPSLPRRRPARGPQEPAAVTPLQNGRRAPSQPAVSPPAVSPPAVPAEPVHEAVVHPLRPTGPDMPALAALGDPFGDPAAEPTPTQPVPWPEPEPGPGPLIDESDPLGLGRLPLTGADEDDRPREPVADSWLADWLSGGWAMPASEPPSPGPYSSWSAQPGPASAPPARPAPRPSPRPAPAFPTDDETGFGLRPESVARLTDDDRELLARLQSELGVAPRPRVSRRAGIAPNGSAPPPTHSDGAG